MNKMGKGSTIVQQFLERFWSSDTNGDPRPPCKYFIGIAPSKQGGFSSSYSCELHHDREAGNWRCSTAGCYRYEPFEPSLLIDGYCCYSGSNVYHIMRYIYSVRWGVTLCDRLVDAKQGAEIYSSDKKFEYERVCSYCWAAFGRLEEKELF